MIEHGGHGRVVAVQVLELQRQALAHVAGEDADRLEALQHRQGLFDQCEGAAQTIGKLDDVEAQVAAFINRVDQDLGDGVVGR